MTDKAETFAPINARTEPLAISVPDLAEVMQASKSGNRRGRTSAQDAALLVGRSRHDPLSAAKGGSASVRLDLARAFQIIARHGPSQLPLSFGKRGWIQFGHAASVRLRVE